MTITLLDIALPVGLAAVFAVYRYTRHLKTDRQTALSKSAADGIKGGFGLLVITLVYKFLTPS
jgi:hypothetical protein